MVRVSNGNVIPSCQTNSTMINAILVCPGLQASSLLSGSDLIPAQFVLLSAYIELASGKELYMTQNNVHGFNLSMLEVHIITLRLIVPVFCFVQVTLFWHWRLSKNVVFFHLEEEIRKHQKSNF